MQGYERLYTYDLEIGAVEYEDLLPAMRRYWHPESLGIFTQDRTKAKSLEISRQDFEYAPLDSLPQLKSRSSAFTSPGPRADFHPEISNLHPQIYSAISPMG